MSKNPQKVNHRVSFHVIKTEALDLLLSDTLLAKVLNKLQKLFATNPTWDKKSPQLPEILKPPDTDYINTRLNVSIPSDR